MKIMSVAAVEEKHTVTLYRNLFIRLLYFRDSREKADQPAIGTALFLAMADCQLFLLLKLYVWRLLRCFARLEVRIVWLKPRNTRPDTVWKLTYESVVVLQRLVVASALYGNTVLRAFQLILKLEEVLVCFQIRIVF